MYSINYALKFLQFINVCLITSITQKGVLKIFETPFVIFMLIMIHLSI